MNIYHLKRIRKRFEIIKTDNVIPRYIAFNLKTFDASASRHDLSPVVYWVMSQYLSFIIFSFWAKKRNKRKLKHEYDKHTKSKVEP